MTYKLRALGGWGLLAWLASGCATQGGAATATPTTEAPQTEPPVAAAAATPKPEKSELLLTLKDAGLSAPEAVLYDAEEDVYLVSNVQGDPLAADSNGFISKVSPEGKVLELKWIDGSKAGSTLNAPKGMVISGGHLYVADITWIRVFDRKTGQPKGKIFVKGATFLNGMAASSTGEVVFSDTGWKSGKAGLETTGTDALFRVDAKTVSASQLVKSADLKGPNGLATNPEGIWVASDQGELFLIGADGKKQKATTLPGAGLDGVVALSDGRFLVSSWKGSAIYVGKPEATFEVLVADLKAPASIGFDTKRGRLLVPAMMDNELRVYSVPGTASAGETASAMPAPAPASASAAVAPVSPAAAPPAKPAVATAPAKPAAAAATPATPAKPAAAAATSATPAKPAAAAAAATPAKPAVATAPAKPAAAAATPATPAKPAPAATPATPAKPATPAAPAGKVEAKAASPAAPATPAKPAAPAAPAGKVEAKAASPAAPATPAKPAAPAAPAGKVEAKAASPAAPATPAKPAAPAAPAGKVEAKAASPAAPATPAKPAAPAAKASAQTPAAK